MIFMGAAVYADFESTLFDATTVADSAVRPIQCPVLLSTSEPGIVSAIVRNTKDTADEIVVRAHITRGHLILMREVEDRIELAPNESKKVDWQVTAQDAAFGHLILVKIIVLDNAENRSHKGSCGIIVVNLPEPIRGWHLFLFILTISAFGIIGGIGLWWKHGRSYSGRGLEATRSILGLGVIISIGLFGVITGFWELAAATFYIGLLLIGVIVPHFLISR